MKVFNIFTSLDFGEVESRACIISKNKTKNTRHSFVSISSGGRAAEVIKDNEGEVYLLMMKTAIPSLEAIFSLYKLFREEKPDIVHTRGAEANFHGLIAACLAGVLVSITEEIGSPNHSTKAKIIFKFSYLFASKVIGISDMLRIGWLRVVKHQRTKRQEYTIL